MNKWNSCNWHCGVILAAIEVILNPHAFIVINFNFPDSLLTFSFFLMFKHCMTMFLSFLWGLKMGEIMKMRICVYFSLNPAMEFHIIIQFICSNIMFSFSLLFSLIAARNIMDSQWILFAKDCKIFMSSYFNHWNLYCILSCKQLPLSHMWLNQFEYP